jgi:hypothetical protein
LGFGSAGGVPTAALPLNRLTFSEYILALSMMFPPVVDAVQGSMFNFHQRLGGSIVPNLSAVPIDQAVLQKIQQRL